jgi:tellurite resistance protein TerA
MGIDYTKRPASAPSSATPPAAAPSTGQPGKVTLTKSAPSVSLSKQGGAGGLLRVNLNWNARPAGGGGGFLSRLAHGSGNIDLDLGCLWELANGDKGVVQALGNAFSAHVAPQYAPIIWLDQDDRSGASVGGENLFVDLNQAAWIRRVLVYTFIYEGVPNWAAANAVVTLYPVSGPQIEVRLDEPDPNAPMCAIALVQNEGGEITVRREVHYIRGGQSALDRAYGWGMNWAPGRK